MPVSRCLAAKLDRPTPCTSLALAHRAAEDAILVPSLSLVECLTLVPLPSRVACAAVVPDPPAVPGTHTRVFVRVHVPGTARLRNNIIHFVAEGVLSRNTRAIRGNENPGHRCEKQSAQSRTMLCRITTDRYPPLRPPAAEHGARIPRRLACLLCLVVYEFPAADLSNFAKLSATVRVTM